MRFLRRSLSGLFLLSLTAGLLALAAYWVATALQERAADDEAPRGGRERVFAANVVTLAPGTVQPELETFGQIRSRRTLELRVAAGGTVLELGPGMEEGGAVARGDLMVRIDPVEAERALAVARTDLEDAEAELRDAERGVALAADDLASARRQSELRQRALERQQDLEGRGIGTAAAVETSELAAATADQSVLSRRQAEAQAVARRDQARTRLARAGIALDEAERALGDTEIRAAFDGTVSDVSVTEGARIAAGEQVAQIVDPDALEVSFRVSTPQYARLTGPGGAMRPAEIRVALDIGELGIATTGRISRESAVVGEGQTGRILFATLDRPAGFRPGDFVTVAVDEPPLERVAPLPAAAVAGDGRVLVLGEDDRLEPGTVTIARRQGDTVLVRAPDLAGREVVAERAPQLGVGIKVRPVRPDAEPEPEPGADDTAAALRPAADAMLELTAERRARLVAFVEDSAGMPAEAKERVLSQLRAPQVPAAVVTRIEGRMGG